MNDAHAFFHRFEQIERRKPIVAVRMEFERNIADVSLNQPHQIARAT